MWKLQAKSGTTPPRHIHTEYDLAVAEAMRLSESLNTEVEILKVVAVVRREEVPVTTTKSVLRPVPNWTPASEDDLPF